jgi:UDP-GlcNAc3NAcA epimerase
MKIVTILGARPQFIKAGSVSREISKYSNIEEIIVHTGQHFDENMSDIFFNEMKIPKPNYNLNINGLTHGAMTGQMLEKIEEILLFEKPDWVIVYGDTNSTLAGALSASKLHIKVAHIEAGLRSFNMNMPEEVNRILTDRVSTILFCPTDTAMDNLKKEGYDTFDCSFIKSGDVMQDGAIFYRKLALKPKCAVKDGYILATIHRAENTDSKRRIIEIFEALNKIALNKQVILPLHPRTKRIIEELKLEVDNLTIIDPVGYLEMIWLIDNCGLVMTDSGGLQKETYFFKKPCITLRDETEWIELVEHGFNRLVGADKDKIFKAAEESSLAQNLNFDIDLYGAGEASRKIIEQLLEY